MQCSKCGFCNPEGMKFCGSCAAELDRICPNCKSANPANFVFCGQCAHKLPTLPFSPQPTRQKTEEAERRQLTVLFCDIVNSTAISSQIDPEDLREIIKDYRSTCSEIVSRYGGHVAQHLGDGILVYFGHPVAHEDDACRAAYAGLEIINQIKQSYFPLSDGSQIQLSLRIGIHTGLVVIGMIGSDKRALALGDTPNIASRIQDHAEPDTLLTSETTNTLLNTVFNTNLIGKFCLKGFQQPIKLYQVLNVNSSPNAIGISYRLYQSPFIGRNQEVNLLLERLELAKKDHCQFVLLSGEPGLGKTRMVQHIYNRIADKQITLVECLGSRYYKNSFFHPIVELLKVKFGISNDSVNADNLKCLEDNIAAYELTAEIALPALAELLSINYQDKYPINGESTPQQKKQLIIDSVLDLFQSMARQQFVVFIAEDLQWIDPSTLELIRQLIEKPGLSNFFALYTFRNDFTISFPQQSNLTTIKLNHLTQHQSGRMIHNLCGMKTLPGEIFSEIINRTDGIPLYIEELTNAVLRSENLKERDDCYELIVPMSRIDIPATLQDSLMSRLDNLGNDKELAQICSILGRDFNHELLSAISPQDDHHLQHGLNHLINENIFYLHTHPPGTRYSFRHALLHDTAYQSLLKQTRQKYHQLISTLIKTKFKYIISENPEIMAYHCTEAGNFKESLEHWLYAGQKAAKQSANKEAIAHYSNGLSALKKLPDSQEKDTWELKFQTHMGIALSICKGYAAPEVENAYSRAKELCNCITDNYAIFPVLCGLWEFYIVRASHDNALNLSRQIMDIAKISQEDEFSIEADRIVGTTLFWRGKLINAMHHFDINNALQSKIKTKPSLSDYCQDPHVAALANGSCLLWLLGKPDQALKQANYALELSNKLSHPFSRAYALQFLATVHQLRGERDKLEKVSEKLIVLSETYKFPFWAATGKMMFTWARSKNKNIYDSTLDFQAALDRYNMSGNKLALSYFLSLYADLQKQSGNIKVANELVNLAIQETETSNEKYFIAELLRLKGELLSTGDTNINHSDAIDYFIKALEVAQQQGARSLALRILISLADLSDSTTIENFSRDELFNMLNSQLEEISEGRDTVDILRARNISDSIKVVMEAN